MGTENLEEEYKGLLAENDQFKQLIRQQKEQLASLDGKMNESQRKIWEKQAGLGGRLQQQKKYRHQRKHVFILENKLKQVTNYFDTLLSRNLALREDIGLLLQQRGTLYKINKKLNIELAIQHKAMEELVEKSIFAYNQRSEAMTHTLEVRERSKKEIAQFSMKMIKLKTVIDLEVKLHNFMDKKFQDIIPPGEVEETEKREAKKAQQEQTEGERLETHKVVHHMLMDVTGESDLREIGEKFIDTEEKHFAYFNYINELHSKSNMLNNCIGKLKSDILVFELENKGYDQQCKSQLKDLEIQLEERRSLANSLENQYTLVLKSLDQQKTAIADLFAKINPAPNTKKLGCSTHITDNVTHCIGILEEGIHDLLMLLILAGNKEADINELPPQNLLLASYDLLPVVAPSNIEAPSGTDQLASEQPLDFVSLCERVLPRVVQMEQGKSPRTPCANQRGKKMGFTFRSA